MEHGSLGCPLIEHSKKSCWLLGWGEVFQPCQTEYQELFVSVLLAGALEDHIGLQCQTKDRLNWTLRIDPLVLQFHFKLSHIPKQKECAKLDQIPRFKKITLSGSFGSHYNVYFFTTAIATELTGNSGYNGERGWETAMHGQTIWFVMLWLVKTGCDDSSLTVGMNIGPFMSCKEAQRDLPLPAGTKAQSSYAWRQELLNSSKLLSLGTSHPYSHSFAQSDDCSDQIEEIEASCGGISSWLWWPLLFIIQRNCCHAASFHFYLRGGKLTCTKVYLTRVWEIHPWVILVSSLLSYFLEPTCFIAWCSQDPAKVKENIMSEHLPGHVWTSETRFQQSYSLYVLLPGWHEVWVMCMWHGTCGSPLTEQSRKAARYW